MIFRSFLFVTILTLSFQASVSLTDVEKEAKLLVSLDVNDIKYFYVPKNGDRVEITYASASSLDASGFKAGRPTTILIDGFLSNDTNSNMTKVLSATLSSDPNMNVVIVDWGAMNGGKSGLMRSDAVSQLSLALYPLAVLNVGPSGMRVGEFINFISMEKNVNLNDVHIIGHSLGTPVAAEAGKKIYFLRRQKVRRITGLDPAGPVYYPLPPQKLRAGDASYVDIYHSNRCALGDMSTITGDVNALINGGCQQPGCENAISKDYCYHAYSWKLFNASIHGDRDNFQSCSCNPLLVLGNCYCSSQCIFPCNDYVVGYQTDNFASGAVYLPSSEPYPWV